ncbi:MAG: M56 family metallopeptidase [Armatimonadota bacterium]|nr:hypothetical protein [Armatimonadota bacterium]MCX7778147.1 hypothetical protein [Armatimonadota bacterium]MDW8024501.1 M56 family metallopeptidase [Armatimonadota bacterium]
MEVALVNAFVFLIASNLAMALTCTTLRATEQLWLHDETAVPLNGLIAAILLPLLIGIAASVTISVSAALCTSRAYPSLCDWQLQKCFQRYAHWCAHAGQGNKLLAIGIAMAISNGMKLAGTAFVVFLAIGRFAWHTVWKSAIKPPSQKLLSVAKTLPEFSSGKVNLAECDSGFCLAGLFGWLKPTCTISSGITNALTENELKALIKHELIHKRRRDHILRLLLRFLSCLFLLLPSFKWLRRHLEEAVERAAYREMAYERCASDFESAVRKVIKMLRDCGASEDVLNRLSLRSQSLRAGSVRRKQLQSHLWLSITLMCTAFIATVLLFSKPIFGTAHCFFEVLLHGMN